jgi:beta-lactam-binding protein with PASTA domain
MALVPNVVDQTLTTAIQTLIDSGFSEHEYLIEDNGPADPAQHGNRPVVAQDPTGGTPAPPDARVQVIVKIAE